MSRVNINNFGRVTATRNEIPLFEHVYFDTALTAVLTVLTSGRLHELIFAAMSPESSASTF